MQRIQLARDSAIVTVLNGTTQVSRFFVFIVIAALFGANWKTDAFFLAQTIPALFINSVKDSLQTVYIPMISDYNRKDPSKAGKLVGSSIFYSLILSTLISVFLLAFLPAILQAAAPNLSAPGRSLAYLQVQLLLPMIAFQLVNGIISAVYFANGLFWPPASSEALRYLFTILLMLLLKPVLDINSLPVSFTAGTLLQTILLAVFWRRNHLRLTFSFKIEEELLRSLKLALPLLAGMIALQIGVVISRFLAAQLKEGSVTLLDYASRISGGIMELLSSGVMLVALADWSNVVSAGDAQKLEQKLQEAIQVTLFLILPLVAILIALRDPVVSILVLRGEFPSESAPLVAAMVAILLLAIPIDVIGRFLVRIHLAYQDTSIIGLLAVSRVFFNVVLSLLFISFFHVLGLAIAEFAAVSITTASLFFSVSRRRKIGLGSRWAGLMVNLTTAVCCGGLTAFTYHRLYQGSIWIPAFAAGLIGVAGYVLFSSLLYRDTIQRLLATIRERKG